MEQVTVSDILIGTLIGGIFTGLGCLPWILFKLGHIKGIYIMPRLPPVMWWKGIYIWPAGVVFISPAIGYFLGIRDSDLTFEAYLSGVGLLVAVFMIIFTPNWAKPKWLRYLEGNYPYREIRRYIPVWRQMSKEWVWLMDSKDGIDKAVIIAQEKLKNPDSHRT